MTDPSTDEPTEPAGAAPGLRWWVEILLIFAFYELYSLVRNAQGSHPTSYSHAFRDARTVISIEKALGVFRERSVQHTFDAHLLVKACNIFYGTAHFAVTAAVLGWLFFRQPERYRRWRWVLACTTLLALIGFIGFPLLPPRLLPPGYGFVDTIDRIGGLWNFDSGPVAKLSNQYAAMPSLHFAWSSWCALSLWPGLRRRWTKALAVAHPAATAFVIVATGNHYVLDAAGGALTLLVGTIVGTAASRSPWLMWRRPPADP